VVAAGCDQCLPVFYGDMGDPELLEHLPLDQARWLVSTIRDRDLNLNLLRTIKEKNFRGRVALTARWETEAEAFLRAGADLVLRPYADAAEQAVEILEK
jgi:Trk K+ transport system NAD-binding subunit